MKIIDLKNLDESFFSKIEFENIGSTLQIIEDVRKNGNKAIKEYSKREREKRKGGNEQKREK